MSVLNFELERIAGIEPASSAWKAEVIAVYDARDADVSSLKSNVVSSLRTIPFCHFRCFATKI